MKSLIAEIRQRARTIGDEGYVDGVQVTIYEFDPSQNEFATNATREFLKTSNALRIEDVHSESSSDELAALRASLSVGYGLSISTQHSINDPSSDLRYVVLRAKKGIVIDRQNPDPDFFDRLRNLDTAMKGLIDEIRKTNDPDVLTQQVAVAKASLEAARSYMDIDNRFGPAEVPEEIVQAAEKSLKTYDWIKISGEANKWALVVIKFFEAFFKDN